MKQMRLGQPPPKSHDWQMGNSVTRAIKNGTYQEPKVKYDKSGARGCSYTKEEIEFVTNNFLKYSDADLAKMFGRTLDAISGLRSRHGLNRERKPPFKVTLINAIREAQLMRELWCITQDMKALIIICQLNISSYKKEHYKKELLKLSNFNLTKIKPLKCN